MKLIQALQCQNEGTPPVWLMRQAGRYMPEYRALRKKHSFLSMCHHPELAAEVTLLPLKRFPLDAAILFSDILVVPEAMGLELYFKEGKGPGFHNPVDSKEKIDRLPHCNVEEKLGYVAETVRHLKGVLDVPLIGFSGAPFTVAGYMIGSFADAKRWLFNDPAAFHRLLDKVAETTIDYLKLQVEAGVDALQIFDSWANQLAFPQFEEYSLAYSKKILEGLAGTDIPVILFSRGTSSFARSLAALYPRCLSFDWACDLSKIRESVPPSIAVQGNLDPDVLYAPHSVIQQEAKRLVDSMKGDPGYIFNLGHGIKPDMDPDAVSALIEGIKNEN